MDACIQECVKKVPNRFELVVLAVGRAKSLGLGVAPSVEKDGDKNTVIALREIEQGAVDLDAVRETIVDKLQRYTPVKESVADAEELKAVDAELMGDAIYSDEELAETGSFQVVDEV